MIDLEADNEEDFEEVAYSGKRNYVNIKPSKFGRTIFRDLDRQSVFSSEKLTTSVVVPNYGILKVLVLPDRVLFQHPVYYRHEVVCSNLDDVQSWMTEFIESTKTKKPNSGFRGIKDFFPLPTLRLC